MPHKPKGNKGQPHQQPIDKPEPMVSHSWPLVYQRFSRLSYLRTTANGVKKFLIRIQVRGNTVSDVPYRSTVRVIKFQVMVHITINRLIMKTNRCFVCLSWTRRELSCLLLVYSDKTPVYCEKRLKISTLPKKCMIYEAEMMASCSSDKKLKSARLTGLKV